MTAVPVPAPAPAPAGVLRVLLRAMDAPPAAPACARALLSPDRRLAAEQAAADTHLFRFRALLDSRRDARVPALDTRVPGTTAPAYAWGRSTSTGGTSSSSKGCVHTATFLAATEAGAVVIRWHAIDADTDGTGANADASDAGSTPNVVRVPPLESAVFAVPWAAQERAVVAGGAAGECRGTHAFVYEIRGGLRGLLVPPRVRVHRVIGVFPADLTPPAGSTISTSGGSSEGSGSSGNSSNSCSTAHFTCITQVRSADGRAACAVSVLSADEVDGLKLLRYFELIIGTGGDGEEETDGEGQEEERPLPPPPAVTCVDWACFVLVGRVVHIVDCRTGTRLGCVDCAIPPGRAVGCTEGCHASKQQDQEEDSLDVVSVSNDLRLLAVGAGARGVCRVVDLARYFRATPRARWLRPGLAFARHIELVPRALDDAVADAAAEDAAGAAAAQRAEVAASDAALPWPDYLLAHLDRAPDALPGLGDDDDDDAVAGPAPVPTAVHASGLSQCDILAAAEDIPAVPDGFGVECLQQDCEHVKKQEQEHEREQEQEQRKQQCQQQQQQCDWMVCLGPPEENNSESNKSENNKSENNKSKKQETEHLALMVAGDALAWFRAERSSDGTTMGPLREVWMYSQLRGWAPAVARFGAADAAVLVGGDGFWYVVCGAARARARGVVALLAGQDAQAVINNLVLFGLAPVADALCEQNAWDRKARCLHTLALALRYKQLDVVARALAALEDDQQARGLALVLAHVRALVDIPAEEDTNSRLVHLATRHIVACALPRAIEREAQMGGGEGDSCGGGDASGDGSDDDTSDDDCGDGDGDNGGEGDKVATVAQLSGQLESLRRLATKLLHAETPKQIEE